MRELINLINEKALDPQSPLGLKKDIVSQVNKTDDINILQRVIKVLKAGNIEDRIKQVFSLDSDAANFIEIIADVIIKIDAPIEEKDKFLANFPKGIVNANMLIDGDNHSYLDLVGGSTFARDVLAALVVHPALKPQGVGPGELALAVLNPKIKWSGRAEGGGDILVGKTAVEVKTTIASGGRWVNARKADLDIAGIYKAITDAFKAVNTAPGNRIPKRLNPTVWVNTIRPVISRNEKSFSQCVKIVAKGLFAHANTAAYEKALLKGSEQDITNAILSTGFENYKNYSGFDGVLLVNNNTQSLQYFQDYQSMPGSIKSDVPYIMAPESEAMPKVTLSAIAAGGIDPAQLRREKRAATAEPAEPAVTLKDPRASMPASAISTPRNRRGETNKGLGRERR
jgi:hypothetical protein